MKSCSRYVGLLMVSVIAVGLIASSIAPRAVGARRAIDVTIDVDLPSESTGTSGGTLAVRIFSPASAGEARYADGAPVLIFVPGGTDAGTLRPQLLQADDVIRIVFLFPRRYRSPYWAQQRRHLRLSRLRQHRRSAGRHPLRRRRTAGLSGPDHRRRRARARPARQHRSGGRLQRRQHRPRRRRRIRC